MKTKTILAAITALPLVAGAQSIVYTDTAPVVDGIVDASWATAEELPIAVWVELGGTSAPEPSALSGSFRTAYDLNNLYLLVEVTDDLVAYHDFTEGWWTTDGVEIYLDPDNSDGVPDATFPSIIRYDGVNDRHIGILPTDPNGTFYYGSNSAENLANTASASVIGGSGYTMEVSFAWSDMGVDPLLISEIGFDIAINDGDAFQGFWPPTRIAWFDNSGTQYQDPSVLGTLSLGVVPEPSTFAILMGFAAAGLVIMRRRRNKDQR